MNAKYRIAVLLILIVTIVLVTSRAHAKTDTAGTGSTLVHVCILLLDGGVTISTITLLRLNIYNLIH